MAPKGCQLSMSSVPCVHFNAVFTYRLEYHTNPRVCGIYLLVILQENVTDDLTSVRRQEFTQVSEFNIQGLNHFVTRWARPNDRYSLLRYNWTLFWTLRQSSNLILYANYTELVEVRSRRVKV